MGVPEDKIRRAKGKKSQGTGVPAQAPTQTQASTVQAAAAENPTEETKEEPRAKLSFDEVMKDPEYNSAMQKIIRERLKSASKRSDEALAKLTPALDLLARRYGMDPADPDYEALAKAIDEDDAFYEKRAMEMNTSVETAKKMDRFEREVQRNQIQQAQTMEQQRMQQHFQNLEQQGEKLKEQFPSFDLRMELQNPVFARMTQPGSGLTVEDAYFAVHRREVQEAGMRAATEMAAKKMSAAVQAGSRRPVENGTSGKAPSVTTFDYRNASPEQRAALRRRIHEASARGEKVYPGQEF